MVDLPSELTIGGTFVGGHLHASHTFPGGRTCAAPACKAVLSRYNSERYCWLHSQHEAPVRLIVRHCSAEQAHSGRSAA